MNNIKDKFDIIEDKYKRIEILLYMNKESLSLDIYLIMLLEIFFSMFIVGFFFDITGRPSSGLIVHLVTFCIAICMLAKAYQMFNSFKINLNLKINKQLCREGKL